MAHQRREHAANDNLSLHGKGGTHADCRDLLSRGPLTNSTKPASLIILIDTDDSISDLPDPQTEQTVLNEYKVIMLHKKDALMCQWKVSWYTSDILSVR